MKPETFIKIATFFYWWAVVGAVGNLVFLPFDIGQGKWTTAGLDLFFVVLNLACLDWWAKLIKRARAREDSSQP